MSRTNIFELAAQNKSFQKDGERIIEIVTEKRIIRKTGTDKTMTLVRFVESN